MNNNRDCERRVRRVANRVTFDSTATVLARMIDNVWLTNGGSAQRYV